jgi:branched-chain amino acid transport system ATP-binding protein
VSRGYIAVEGRKCGGIQTVKVVDPEIGQGELVTLIGTNGAGKTTTMKAITGLKPYFAGDIKYIDHVDQGRAVHEFLKRGFAMAPKDLGTFARMSVLIPRMERAWVRKGQGDEAQSKAAVVRALGWRGKRELLH